MASDLRRALFDITNAPSMPSMSQTVTSRLFFAWPNTAPALIGVCAAAAALLDSVAQNCEVKRPALNPSTAATPKTRIGASLQTVTIVLTTDALSTPLAMSSVNAQISTADARMDGRFWPPANAGTNVPTALMSIVQKAMFVNQSDTQ